jgi:hypothetical protein
VEVDGIENIMSFFTPLYPICLAIRAFPNTIRQDTPALRAGASVAVRLFEN